MQPVQMLHFSPTTKHLIVSSNGQHPELMVWSLETLSIWSYHINVQGIFVTTFMSILHNALCEYKIYLHFSPSRSLKFLICGNFKYSQEKKEN